jgi:hypothetical protein
MAIYALTGNDSLILNDRVIKELSDGSTIEVSYQNDRIGMSTGKNNNTVIAENRQGLNASLTLRVVRGGADDRWLNGLSIQQDKDLPSFNLINGSFTKRIGNGQGSVKYDNYTLLGGVFNRFPDVQENLVGDTEQGTVVYTIMFAQCQRGLS